MYFKKYAYLKYKIDFAFNRKKINEDLKKKLEEIEIRKQIDKFEKNMHYFDDQPTFFVVLAHLKLKIMDLEGALNYMNEIMLKLYP